ncbi:MAG: hypothetical protein EA401_02170, partial [Planctomycetota bacterium]
LAHQSPELVLGERLPTPASDVYSLGALLYTLISGTCLHSDNNTFTLSHNVMTQDPVPLRQRVSDLSDELIELVDRSLDKNADLRPQDAAAFSLAARRIAHGLPMKSKVRAVGQGALNDVAALEALVSIPDLIDPNDSDLEEMEKGAHRIAMRRQSLKAWRALEWIARDPWIKRKAGRIAELMSEMKMVQPTDTIVVGPKERYTSIADAMFEAPKYAMILVKPGVYSEPLKIQKPIYLVGIGSAKNIRIDVSGSHALEIAAEAVLVSGITLRVVNGDGKVPFHALYMLKGRAVVCNTLFAGTGLSSLMIGDRTTRPVPPPAPEESQRPQRSITRTFLRAAIRANETESAVPQPTQAEPEYAARVWMGDCRMSGPAVCGIIANGGHATIEHSQMSAGTRYGLDIRQGAGCDLFESQVNAIKGVGVLIRRLTQVNLSQSRIHENSVGGIELRDGATPRIHECRIHSNGEYGIAAAGEQCEGVYEQCEIAFNKQSNVTISDGAQTIFRNCQINKGLSVGISGKDGGRARFLDCRIEANTKFGAYLESASQLVFERCHVLHGKAPGIQCARGSSGSVIDCSFDGTKSDSLIIEPGSRTVHQ